MSIGLGSLPKLEVRVDNLAVANCTLQNLFGIFAKLQPSMFGCGLPCGRRVMGHCDAMAIARRAACVASIQCNYSAVIVVYSGGAVNACFNVTTLLTSCKSVRSNLLRARPRVDISVPCHQQSPSSHGLHFHAAAADAGRQIAYLCSVSAATVCCNLAIADQRRLSVTCHAHCSRCNAFSHPHHRCNKRLLRFM